jgi:hypothetical protein
MVMISPFSPLKARQAGNIEGKRKGGVGMLASHWVRAGFTPRSLPSF